MMSLATKTPAEPQVQVPPIVETPRKRVSRRSAVSRSWQLYVLLAPAVVFLIIFKYWPMYGAQIAFRNYNPAEGFLGSPWVGLQHFERFINSFQFQDLLVN